MWQSGLTPEQAVEIEAEMSEEEEELLQEEEMAYVVEEVLPVMVVFLEALKEIRDLLPENDVTFECFGKYAPYSSACRQRYTVTETVVCGVCENISKFNSAWIDKAVAELQEYMAESLKT